MASLFNGSLAINFNGQNQISGEEVGAPAFAKSLAVGFLVGAVAPSIEGGGGYAGTFTCPSTGGTLNLADSANICKTGAVGTIKPFQSYVITAAKRLRALYLQNLDATRVVTVTCPATLFVAGLGWVASQVVCVLQPGGNGVFCQAWPTGSSVLVAATNDALVFTSDAGTPTVAIGALFG